MVSSEIAIALTTIGVLLGGYGGLYFGPQYALYQESMANSQNVLRQADESLEQDVRSSDNK